MEEISLYQVKDMDTLFEGFSLDSIMVSDIEYKITISERVRKDLEAGRVALNAIECSLMNIPNLVYKEIGEEDFLIDCSETKTRLVLSKTGTQLEVILACPSAELQIY